MCRASRASVRDKHEGSPVNVIVVEPRELTRRGLVEILSAIPWIRLALTSASLTVDLESIIATPRPRVVVVSSDTGRSDADLLNQGTRKDEVLVLIRSQDDPDLAAAATLNAAGFLLEPDVTVESLGRSIRRMSMGEVCLPRILLRYLQEESRTSETSPSASYSLTGRENQVLNMIAKGMTNKEIARSLALSTHTTKRYVAMILIKLDRPNRASAVARALNEQLL